MTTVVTQLPFHFAPSGNCSLDYFVIHSGVVEGYQTFIQSFQRILDDHSSFEMLYVHGPSGVGKAHLAGGFQEVLDAYKIPCFVGVIGEDMILRRSEHDRACGHVIGSEHSEKKSSKTQESEVSIEEFINIYQKMKSRGGLCVIIAQHVYEKEDINPHLASRFFSGHIISLSYPQEEELYPILVSLLERYHLRLPEKQLRNIIEMVPGIPHYFEEISGKMNQLMEERGRVTSSMIKEVIHSDQIRMKVS